MLAVLAAGCAGDAAPVQPRALDVATPTLAPTLFPRYSTQFDDPPAAVVEEISPTGASATAAGAGTVTPIAGAVDWPAVLRATGWPEHRIPEALAIIDCESRGNPTAVGDGGNSLGGFQVWSGWFAPAGESRDAWADPHVNARVALYVLTTRGRWGGAGGWTCADLRGIP